ncbi:helix-turn-helix domain-containing protein [Aphanizomenon flos-aquae]|uniref:helix-turn-helix domain-containing protein n=1 Tax=Aphanizomenon flos-aquae TaxID=1176 RepID=UPI0030D3A012
MHLEEITLKHLREKLGLSQSELAERLEVQQPAVSKLERRQNLELNTLRAVVNALGGTIEIIVRVPNKEPILLSDYQE